jgi:hypothetical protein
MAARWLPQSRLRHNVGLRLDSGVQTAIRTQVVPSPTFAHLATASDKALQPSNLPEI